jgi:tetratricopeptide (TPR) repeat protein
LIAQEMLAALEKVETKFAHGLVHTAMGEVYLANGESAKAATFLRDCLRIVDGTRVGGMLRGSALGYLCDANLALGDIEEARRCAEEAVEFSRPRELKWTVQPWLSLARVRIQSSDEAGAREIIAEAQQVIEETDAIIFEPFLHECRAEFAQAFECDWSASDEMREAHRLFEELGAEGHVQRVARLL